MEAHLLYKLTVYSLKFRTLLHSKGRVRLSFFMLKFSVLRSIHSEFAKGSFKQ